MKWNPSTSLPLCTSLPVRGAWVEIFTRRARLSRLQSLPVRGAWVEMACHLGVAGGKSGRSPCGERGLKSPCCSYSRPLAASLPVRGAWVEMLKVERFCALSWSLPVRGAWVEISNAVSWSRL